jgi:hypothetical protein
MKAAMLAELSIRAGKFGVTRNASDLCVLLVLGEAHASASVLCVTRTQSIKIGNTPVSINCCQTALFTSMREGHVWLCWVTFANH